VIVTGLRRRAYLLALESVRTLAPLREKDRVQARLHTATAFTLTRRLSDRTCRALIRTAPLGETPPLPKLLGLFGYPRHRPRRPLGFYARYMFRPIRSVLVSGDQFLFFF
jgi:hypothetical protein